MYTGAHTLGRSYPHRSGFGKESTKYTKDGPGTKDGTKGGSSWTVDWLKFDNSYFTDIMEQRDPELLVLETDDVLIRDEGFRCDPTHTSLVDWAVTEWRMSIIACSCRACRADLASV